MASSSFDYDVIVIDPGFGGSVAAMRAVEKGYKTAVLEAGKRWTDDELPKTNWHVSKFAWQPELEMFGIQRVRYLDDVIVLSGAGVGGGSLVYANTLYYPHDKFFNAPTWSHLADWKAETAACYDLTQRMFGVMPSPYMDTDGDRIVKSVAMDMNRPYVRAPLGIYFGTPGVEADDPYFGGAGPRRTGCISCGGCMSGCAYNAKNKLTTNYLYLAEKRGADVKDLHEVHELKPLDGGGFEVVARHPGLLGRAERHHHYTAQQVVVSAHVFGTAQLLMHMKHKGHLDKLSDEIGKRARTNSEALISVSRSEGNFKADPQRHHIVPGTSAVTAAIQADEESTMGPCYYNVGSDAMALLFTGQTDGTEYPFHAFVKELVHHPGKTLSIDDARQWSQRGFVMLCMRDHDDWLDPSLGARHAAVETRLVGRAPTDSRGRERCLETRRRQARRPARRDLVRCRRQGNVVPLHRRNDDGDSADQGVIDPYQRAFGYPGLHIMDGSVIAANPGVNPSLTISALAERAMSFWPNKGDEDARPPLGSGYDRIQPVMPHAPIVPKGAPAEYRLDATEVDDLTLTWDPAASR